MDNYLAARETGASAAMSSPATTPASSSIRAAPTPTTGRAGPADGGSRDEATIPILHGNPYGPAVTDGQPNCQAGQTGYSLGEALLPGQDPHNPTFGVNTITSAAGVPPLGRTDLFLTQQGDRIFWDSENNPPLDP